MKKLISIISVIIILLSLTSCGGAGGAASDIDNLQELAEANTEADTDMDENDSSSSISFDGVTDFDDFVEKLEDSGYKTSETETDDGHLIVDMQTPSPDDDSDQSVTPAIPTIDDLVKPTDPKPTPDKDETSSQQPAPSKPEKDETASKDPEPPAKEEETSKPDPKPTPDKDETSSAPETPKQEETFTTYTYTTGQSHQKLHYTKRYLYSILTAEQKEWYRQIDAAVNALDEKTATIHTDLTENKNYFIYFIYMFDNPEHFYLSNTVAIYNNGNGTGTLRFVYSVGNEQGDYCGYGYGELTDELKSKIRAKKQTFENEAKRILSTIPANAPDVWKEKLIYDRILLDSYYNLGAQWDGLAEDNWTAYGILVNKYGVCESYSEAFQTLCLYAGIRCTGVVGTAGGGHKWNCVQLDGEWYMCDITFDDPIGGDPNEAYHTYFNLTSSRMNELNHDWSNCEYSVPNCTGTKYAFTYFR